MEDTKIPLLDGPDDAADARADAAWDAWWAANHPWSWWEKERGGQPLPTFDRVLVEQLARKAWFASTFGR